MLEKIDLTKSLGAEEYKAIRQAESAKLSLLQRQLKDAKVPVVVLFEGLGAAGKGTQINRLIQALDPRGFDVYAVNHTNDEETMRPFLWSFWIKTPEKGRIAIFDRSWYKKVLIDRFDGATKKKELPKAFQDINSFEKLLTDDGVVIIKLFLYISKKEQKKRFKALAADKSTSWHVSEGDRERNRRYDEYIQISEEMLENTDTPFAPWTVIEATDKRYAAAKIMKCVNRRLAQAMADYEQAQQEKTAKQAMQQAAEAEETAEAAAETAETAAVEAATTAEPAAVSDSILAEVDLNKSLTEEEYQSRLDALQKKLATLHSEIYTRRIPVVIGFEGWDAAGKGGAIRRLTSRLDPRGYKVCPAAAPNDIEKKHHHLWRFWNNVPKAGHIAIFDRTWYGRVMVERIEGFCTTEEWKRAYRELNEFEAHLANSGSVVLKFWLHIDKDEQLRRFTDRQNMPEKQWKITDEDWRNRDKWNAYLEAVDEMLLRTSTTYAPWIVVEGNDKKYARIKVLQTVADALEAKLAEKK